MFFTVLPVCVTLLLGVAGFIVNTLIQRQSNSIEVITKNRIERMNKTKEIMSAFVKYSDIDVLNAIKNKKSVDDAIIDLNEKYAVLRSLYTYTFDKDVDLLKSVFLLKTLIVNYLNNNIDIEKFNFNIKNFFQKLEKNFDIYIMTDWCRIKAETIGKRNTHGIDYWQLDYERYSKKYISG